MNSLGVSTIKENGKLTLPNNIVESYQFKKETKFRIIEIQRGVLLISLTIEPMNNELKAELKEWQAIGAERLDNENTLPYQKLNDLIMA